MTDEGRFVPGDPPTLVSGPAYASWTAYHNGYRISEAQFYAILGEDELAREAASWKSLKSGLGWAGLGSLGLGLSTAFLTGFIAGRDSGDLPFYLALGSVGAGGGFWIAYLSMGFNYRPLDEARRMAEAYNRGGSQP